MVGCRNTSHFHFTLYSYWTSFWKLAEPQRTQDFQIVLEHIALSGGLLLAAIATKK